MPEIERDNLDFIILAEIDGEVHLVGMDRSKLEAVEAILRNTVSGVVPTGRTANEVLKYLGYKK